jgi:hypothetical protein
MDPDPGSGSSGVIQWEDSDTEEAQDSKTRQQQRGGHRTANQILHIPGNEVSIKSARITSRGYELPVHTGIWYLPVPVLGKEDQYLDVWLQRSSFEALRFLLSLLVFGCLKSTSRACIKFSHVPASYLVTCCCLHQI